MPKNGINKKIYNIDQLVKNNTTNLLAIEGGRERTIG